MPGPLDGIRVIDFTHALAAPFGTMVLADLGAEVINVVKIDERDATPGPGPGTKCYFLGNIIENLWEMCGMFSKK